MTADRTSTLALLGVLVLVAGPMALPSAAGEYFDSDLMVGPEWLLSYGSLDAVRVVDFARTPEEYADGHVPGAVYVDMERITAAAGDVPTMLAHPERVGNVLRG
ncbi:MAG: hypothetical protein ABIE42_10460, partial [Candidatus Eisenbacteria bacterium]